MTNNKEEPAFRPIGVRIIRKEDGTERLNDAQSVAERLLKKPKIIHVFTDHPDQVFDPQQFQEYISKMFGPNFTVVHEGDLLTYVLSHNLTDKQTLASELAKAKHGATTRGMAFSYGDAGISLEDKMRLETEIIDLPPTQSFYEAASQQTIKGNVRGKIVDERVINNTFYDQSALSIFFSNQLAKNADEDADHMTLIITGRGIGNREGMGLHMRAAMSSLRFAMISTTGLVEAPGKPLELEEQIEQNRRAGMSDIFWFDDEERQRKYKTLIHQGIRAFDAVQQVYQDRMLFHHDPRLNEAVKGLSLQMILFAFGETYGTVSQCSTTDLALGHPDLSKSCRLHDGHWHEEILAVQCKSVGQPEFCTFHTELFQKLQGR